MPPKRQEAAIAADKDADYALAPVGNRGRSAKVLLQTRTQRQTRSKSTTNAPNVQANPSVQHPVLQEPDPMPSPEVLVPARPAQPVAQRYRQLEKPQGLRIPPMEPLKEVGIDLAPVDVSGGPMMPAQGPNEITAGTRAESKGKGRGTGERGYQARRTRESMELSMSEREVTPGSGDDEYLYETGSSIDLEESTFKLQADEVVTMLSSSSSSDDFVVDPKPAPAKPRGGTGVRKAAKSTAKKAAPIEDNGPFQVRIYHMFQGRERKVDISSMSDFVEVREAIAKAIKINVRSLQPLLYKIPVDRKQTTFRELMSDEDWITILEVGRTFRLKQLKKLEKDGEGNPDDWHIKTKEEEVKTKGKVHAADPPPVSIKSPRVEAMEVLQRARQCPAHAGSLCWQPGIGDRQAVEDYGLTKYGHIQITGAELEKWVDEKIDNNASDASPGAFLGRMICKRFAQMLKTKEDLASNERFRLQATNPNTATPSFARTFQPPPEPTPVRPLNVSRAQSAPVPSASTPPSASTSTPAIAGAIPGAHYHPINTWLAELNSSRRIPNDSTDYTSLLNVLINEDVQSTFEIIEMGREGLTGIGPIKSGTATRLVAWAIEDRDRKT